MLNAGQNSSARRLLFCTSKLITVRVSTCPRDPEPAGVFDSVNMRHKQHTQEESWHRQHARQLPLEPLHY